MPASVHPYPRSQDARRPLVKLLLTLALFVLAMTMTLGLLWVFQRSLIYLPSGGVPPPPVGVERVSYETDDGLTLSAWFLRAEDERGSVIVFNGNAGNRSDRLPLGTALVDEGLSVLLTDYRGYGGNPGSPSEEGLAADARAALAYMKERDTGSPIAYFGESLGAGVAIRLALEDQPGALILRSPFTSLPDVAAVHYRFLPSSLLLQDRYPNIERIPDVEAPVMVIAGSDDDIVPTEQSRRIYEAAIEPKEWVLIEGAGHNDRPLLDGREMMERVSEFLAGP